MSPAALCDLDGVLVDSGPVVERAWRRIAERTGLLGRDPADCVVLVDSHAGLAAGRAAGARPVGVATPFLAEMLDADVVVGAIADVLQLFD